jgi:hypothetical protein
MGRGGGVIFDVDQAPAQFKEQALGCAVAQGGEVGYAATEGWSGGKCSVATDLFY